jgi:hypothetical protein
MNRFVWCVHSRVATLAHSQRAAVAKAVEMSHPCGRRASNPSLVVSARRCCNSRTYAVCGDACAERSRAANVGYALHVSRSSTLFNSMIVLAYYVPRLHDSVH